MKTMRVSEFKAKCIAVLKGIEQSGEPVVVTRRGRPMARVEAVGGDNRDKQLGTLRGSLRLRRNLVRSDTRGDWEMLTDEQILSHRGVRSRDARR
jgi:antitoxin (DNA-binding transcriptional repressor) of toxin-antitoxin stability system